MLHFLNLALLDTMADWEVGYLTAYTSRTEFQREPGAVRLRTVGLTSDPVRTVGGLTVVPDATVDQLDPADSAMLVLPGADTWAQPEQRVWLDQAQRFLDAGVPVAAICGATYALAAAGMLDDRPHTGPDKAFLASTGYAGTDHFVVDELVVTDGDLITASPVAPVEFAAAVFARLGLYEPTVLASWYKLYGDQDAAGFHELMAAS
jgi:putative intracellular protease/amidase